MAAAIFLACVMCLAAFTGTAVHAIQFELDGSKTKCVGEMMNKHDIAKGKYRVLDLAEGAKAFIDIKAVGPAGENEYTASDSASGTLAFTAGDSGSHKICFTNTGFDRRKIVLDFATGAEAQDYEDIAKREHLRPLELELRRLEDRVESVHREMMYQREREETHRNTNESTNARVVWFSVLTITIVLTVGVSEVYFLYSFFKRKKYL